VLQKVLEAVRWAPSWANTQCSEIVVAMDPKVKSELAATLPQTNPALRAMTDAPLVLVLCGKKGVSGCYKGQVVTVKGDWLMFDTGLAMQNLCLAAHAQGLGTVVVGMFDHKKAEQVLSVPEGVEVVAMTPLGYPASGGATSKRREISELVFYDRYPVKG
jgi:nitroreductase